MFESSLPWKSKWRALIFSKHSQVFCVLFVGGHPTPLLGYIKDYWGIYHITWCRNLFNKSLIPNPRHGIVRSRSEMVVSSTASSTSPPKVAIIPTPPAMPMSAWMITTFSYLHGTCIVGTPSMAVTAGSTEAAEAQTVQSQRPRTGESWHINWGHWERNKT